MSINVVQDGKKFKVLVDHGMNGSFPYSSAIQANKEAKKIKDSQYPHAHLVLLSL